MAPSSYEGFGLPIVEAGRLGCPAVYAMGSAMAEVAATAESVTQQRTRASAQRSSGRSYPAVTCAMSWVPGRERTLLDSIGFAPRTPSSGRRSPPQRRRTLMREILLCAFCISLRHSRLGTGSAIIGYAKAIQAQGIESSLLAQDRGSGLFEELGESSPFATARIIAPGLVNLWRAIGSTVEEVEARHRALYIPLLLVASVGYEVASGMSQLSSTARTASLSSGATFPNCGGGRTAAPSCCSRAGQPPSSV